MVKLREVEERFLTRGVLLLMITAIAGCSGSGSAGFDNRPAQEQAVMGAVNTQGTCQSFEGTTLCPRPEGSFTQDKAAPFIITATPPLKKGLSCVLESEPPHCRAKIGITPEKGVVSSDRFLVAIRYNHPVSSSWKIASSFGAPSNTGTLETDLPIKLSAENTAKLDVAVLAYKDALQTLPATDATQEVLSDFKPTVAFVALDVAVTGTGTTTPTTP